MKANTQSLKKRLRKAEQQITPSDIEIHFYVVDSNGNETGEGMIVRPNHPTEFFNYTPQIEGKS